MLLNFHKKFVGIKTEVFCITCGKELAGRQSRRDRGKTRKFCCKKCYSIWQSMQKGGKNTNWRGGVHPARQTLYNSKEGENWKKKVLLRDNNTCQSCDSQEELHVHHIKSFAEYPKLRCDVSNGITLCKKCHQTKGLHKKRTVSA